MRFLVAVVALLTGCSFATSRPPRTSSNGYVECSTSRAAPALDVAMAASAGFVGVLGMSFSDQGRSDDDDEQAVGVLALAAAAVYTASAASGYRKASACQSARLAAQPMWVTPSGIPDAEPEQLDPDVIIEDNSRVIEYETEEIDEVHTHTRRTRSRVLPLSDE